MSKLLFVCLTTFLGGVFSSCGYQLPDTCGGNRPSQSAADHYYVLLDDGSSCKEPSRYYANSPEEAQQCAVADGAIPGGEAADVEWCEGERPIRPYLYDNYSLEGSTPNESQVDTTCDGTDPNDDADRFTVYAFYRDSGCLANIFDEVYANSASEAASCKSNTALIGIEASQVCEFAMTYCYCMNSSEQSGSQGVLAQDSQQASSCVEFQFGNFSGLTVSDVTSQATNLSCKPPWVAWSLGAGSWSRPSCSCP